MIEPKQNFLDRIEQAFILYKSNFMNVSLLYIGFILLNGIIFKGFTILITFLGLDFVNVENLNIDTSIYINLVYISIIFMIIFLTFLIIHIPFYISLVLNIKQLYNGEIITYKDNFFIALKDIKKIFYTYWYIFRYVWLIPSLLLIIGLLVILYDFTIGSVILVVTFFIVFYFIFFRGTQVSFSLLSAISYDNYDENNFKKSISITKNKLWRIFWNIVGLGIIIFLMLLIVNSFLTLFLKPNNYSDIITSITSQYNNPDFDLSKNLTNLKNQLTPTFTGTINSILYGIINDILKGIITIFTLIFTYVFFKRLEKEIILDNEKKIGNL